jgi:hypothetical protein
LQDETTYLFKIDGQTPASMSFGRLLEYYAEIKRLIGVSDKVHLVDIVEGSHVSSFKIDSGSTSDVLKRVIEINQGVAPPVALRAQQTINAMLIEDRTSGSFFDSRGANVIPFPGMRPSQAASIRIRSAASFVGELYHIAGAREDAKVRINTKTHGVVFCTTTKGIAKELRDFLFESVKVSGRGMWFKAGPGDWVIESLVIADFAPVYSETLRQGVNRLRDMKIAWPEDPLEQISEIEERRQGLN